jgi:hypothetical protein
MGFFNKKETIPAIPTSPSLPALPQIAPLDPVKENTTKKDLPELPSFPTGPKNENLNQGLVKSAVSDTPSDPEEEESLGVPPKPFGQSSIPELPKPLSPIPSSELMPQKPMTSPIPGQGQPPSAEAPKQRETIFVRVDKFQAAQKNLGEIKSKVTQIESIIEKIKNIKSQEEEELKGWTEDTEKLKSRLAEIDNDIFSQV